MDQDLIRKAVELANGFEVQGDWLCYQGYLIALCKIDRPNQVCLDALAAQLVRQVDATKHWFECSTNRGARVWLKDGSGKVFSRVGDARTPHTIRAIVESGVLQTDDD